MKFFHHIVIIVFAVSCTNQVREKQPFLLIMPDTTTASGKILNEWRMKANDMFRLPMIDRGVDSFELRIWSTGKALELASPDAVMILKYSSTNWQLDIASLYSGLVEDSSQHEVTNQLHVESRIPSVDLLRIIDKVDQINLTSIPSQGDLPNFVDNSTNGFYYTIELATNRYYKLLRYHNPELFPTERNNHEISRFIKYFIENL